MENQIMKNSIVITSIFDPTEAVIAFSKMSNYTLIVVGDKKTPSDWVCDNVTYLSLEIQNDIGKHLNKVLPFNHYSRKMLGYLYAITNEADIIIDTDDDNIPKENWGFPAFNGIFDYIPDNKGHINIYSLYTNQKIWPRGLPLRLINKKNDIKTDLFTKEVRVGVWQGLADEDPDVDAIYRLTLDIPCTFYERKPVVLGYNTITPFNTQNTVIRKELFPLLYLPTYVTFRFTDILRGLVAQPIMWAMGYHLGFVNATVVQIRNPHDYFKDFISEIPMYQNAEKVTDIVSHVVSKDESVSSNLYKAYEALKDNDIVSDQELITLKAWLNDLDLIKIY
jgi:hypothetical protein